MAPSRFRELQVVNDDGLTNIAQVTKGYHPNLRDCRGLLDSQTVSAHRVLQESRLDWLHWPPRFRGLQSCCAIAGRCPSYNGATPVEGTASPEYRELEGPRVASTPCSKKLE